MSKRGHVEYLADIREAILRVQRYTTNLSYEEFLKDSRTQDAVVRNLEIIGEAAKHVPTAFTRKHADIEWAKVAGLRDRLVHHYFGVNWDILWDVVTTKLQPLLDRVEAILSGHADR